RARADEEDEGVAGDDVDVRDRAVEGRGAAVREAAGQERRAVVVDEPVDAVAAVRVEVLEAAADLDRAGDRARPLDERVACRAGIDVRHERARRYGRSRPGPSPSRGSTRSSSPDRPRGRYPYSDTASPSTGR